MRKIKMIKEKCKDEESYEITEMDYMFIGGGGEVTKDLDQWMAVIYEFGDYAAEQAWGKTPLEAANKALGNYDLKIGMEVT
jgi:hypothetical protein